MSRTCCFYFMAAIWYQKITLIDLKVSEMVLGQLDTRFYEKINKIMFLGKSWLITV